MSAMPHDVFISHSAKDHAVANEVCAALEREGIRCWIAPRDIVPGTSWGEAIIDAIGESRLMVLIFSSNANSSRPTIREVERADHRNIVVIPFRIEDVAPTKALEFFISTSHWLDAFSPPMERHLRRLVDIVKAQLPRPGTPERPEAAPGPFDLRARLDHGLLGRYAIEREIGRGGTATVYLARDLRNRRVVAIKALSAELTHALGAARFLREIEIAANLNHPRILPLFDSGEANGVLYYVMPYVEGETLGQLLSRERRLPEADALRIAGQVASALSYAHGRGVVHRDIKPANILLSQGEAVVADFGIARAISMATDDALTQTGLVLGTPAYMSPEQAAGDAEVNERSDIFSLGCVLYEMLAGGPPFSGTTSQTILASRSSPAPLLRSTGAAVSAGVEQLVARALALAPSDRFGSAAELAAAITRAAERRGEAVPVRVAEPAVPAAALEPSPALPAPPATRQRSRGGRRRGQTARPGPPTRHQAHARLGPGRGGRDRPRRLRPVAGRALGCTDGRRRPGVLRGARRDGVHGVGRAGARRGLGPGLVAAAVRPGGRHLHADGDGLQPAGRHGRRGGDQMVRPHAQRHRGRRVHRDVRRHGGRAGAGGGRGGGATRQSVHRGPGSARRIGHHHQPAGAAAAGRGDGAAGGHGPGRAEPSSRGARGRVDLEPLGRRHGRSSNRPSGRGGPRQRGDRRAKRGSRGQPERHGGRARPGHGRHPAGPRALFPFAGRRHRTGG